ncbi:MAG: DUF1697 domain-containing protein [Cystobacter sp.]
MTRLLALLRGVNVSGQRKIPMAELREACTQAGLASVETYIQSGNVLFSTSKPAQAAATMEKLIRERFGFPVDVVTRTQAQWSAYVAANPFPQATEQAPSHVMLLVSQEPPREDALAALSARATQGEVLAACADGLVIHYTQGAGRSKLSPSLIDRLVGSPTTARNWRTVLTLQQRLEAGPSAPAPLVK